MRMFLISILLSLTLLSCNTEQPEELPLPPFETYFTPPPISIKLQELVLMVNGWPI
jgi:hypothetical protein